MASTAWASNNHCCYCDLRSFTVRKTIDKSSSATIILCWATGQVLQWTARVLYTAKVLCTTLPPHIWDTSWWARNLIFFKWKTRKFWTRICLKKLHFFIFLHVVITVLKEHTFVRPPFFRRSLPPTANNIWNCKWHFLKGLAIPDHPFIFHNIL
jgi:hypothetical protein